MIPKELLKALRQIEIHTSRLATDALAGNYQSVFRGQGIAFREVRPYQPGDDVRLIDWNRTARMGEPFVKIFTEEREMTVMLVVDVSASMRFGTTRASKGRVAAEVARSWGKVEPETETYLHDLDALDFTAFRAGLVGGIAAHHAGMLPLFRTIVEELFSAGLIKVVFATETLALGIHMPARAVVLEKTTKFNGDTHAMLTSAEYSQITGRAGRRGIDTKGTAVVLDQQDLDLDALSALVDTPRFPLRSAFTPDYSMAVNLVEQLGVAEATSLIGRSFAQFQTDRTLVSRSRAVERRADERDRLRADLEAAGGGPDLDQYMALRADLSRLERSAEKTTRDDRLDAVRAAMLKQTPGSVITVGRKRFGMVATVLQVRTDIPADPALLCLTDTGWTGGLLSLIHISEPTRPY